MMFNPELRRNIWLECTPHRMIITPIIIAGILFLAYKTFSLNAANTAAYYIAIFFMYIWGTKRASESITDEVNNNTWDFQRLSTITPWSMTWGKLFGSTIYTWYGAALALTPFVYFNFLLGPKQNFLLNLAFVIFGAILCHGLALLTTLEAVQYDRTTKTRSFKYFIFALFIGWFYTNIIQNSTNYSDIYPSLSWHGLEFAQTSFLTVSFYLFVAWCIVGIYRSMQKELQYKNIPWVWGVFSLYCIVYFSGFFNFSNLSFLNESDLLSGFSKDNQTLLKNLTELKNNSALLAAFFIGSYLTYIGLFTEKLDIVRYQKLIAVTKKHSFLTGLTRMPKWPISFILTIIAGIWFILVSPQVNLQTNYISGTFSPFMFIAAWIFLFCRDIGIIHYFQFDKKPARANLTALLYLGLLYILIPGILSVLQLHSFSAIFLPSFDYHVMSLGGAFIQAIIMSSLVYLKWNKQTNRKLATIH